MHRSSCTFHIALIALWLIAPGRSASGQDLDTVDLCVFLPSGEHPARALVQFVDPETGEVLQDGGGQPRSYTLMNRGCVSGAGVVSNEVTPEVVPGDMTVYPNPVSNTATARWTVDAGYRHGHVRVLDLLGREVTRSPDRALGPGEYRAQMSTGSLAAGMYFVQFVADGGVRRSGRFMSVGGATRGGAAEISFDSASDRAAATDDHVKTGPAGKRTGDVRVRVVALGHRLRERTFFGVQDGDRLSVSLDEAPALEVYTLDMTHHREPITAGTLYVRELTTGFEEVIPFSDLPIMTSAASDSVSMRVEAEGFTIGVQAVRPGAPGDYSHDLSGVTFDPESAPTLYVAPDYEGPMTLGAVPDRMIDDGSLRLYIRRFSGLESGWVPEWRLSAHTVMDLESYSVTRYADSTIPNDRVRPIYRYDRDGPVPDSLFSLVFVAFERLADVVNERTFYRYRSMESTGTFNSRVNYGVALDNGISGVADYFQRHVSDSNNLTGIHLWFDPSDNQGGETRTTLTEVMGTLAHARLWGNHSTDTIILFNDLYLYVSGLDLAYRPLVGDFMGMQSFLRQADSGSEYGTNPVHGVFHTVPPSLGKAGAF